MDKLISELQRLYFLDPQPGYLRHADNPLPAMLTPAILAQHLAGECTVSIELPDAQGMLRAMVVCVENAGNWDAVASLFQAVQNDLALPAPAISVSGQEGFSIWFSLARPLPVAQARIFLTALQANYLPDSTGVKPALHPASGAEAVDLVPAFVERSGKWSAFIDPSMGSMFAEESGLDMAPNMDRQAEMLAALRPIEEAEFQHALTVLQAMGDQPADTDAAAENSSARPQRKAAGARSILSVGSDFSDPRDFLRAVMNDPAASAKQRIRAAKALLPYVAGSAPD